MNYLNIKKTIYFLFFGLVLTACSSEPHYVVKGVIDGSDSITFYLQKREAGTTVTIDSALSRKGTFTMKGGAVDYPQLIQLVAGNTRMQTSFYLENSVISITGQLDSLYQAKVEGSNTQDEYMSFVDSNKPLSEQYSALYLEYQAAGQTSDNAKIAEIEKRADSIQIQMIKLHKDFITNNPASYVSPSLIASLSSEVEATELETLIDGLDTAVAAIPLVKSLKEMLAVMKVVSIGQKAPDFVMNDVEGNPITFSSKIGARLLLLDFWAAWCGPCRQENPNVVKVYNKYHKKGFDVFGVSLDRTKEDWVKAIADDKLTWTHVSDLKYWSNSAAELYGVKSIPSNFLLDETGTIIGRNLRGEDLYNKVDEILGGK